MNSLKFPFLLFLLTASLFSCKNECDFEEVPLIDRGCGDFQVYRSFGNDSTFIKVIGERDFLTLSEEACSFDLAANPFIKAEIEQYNLPGRLFCTDAILVGLEVTRTWTGISGTVRTQIVRPSTPCDPTYVIDVSLENAVFEDENGEQILVPDQIFDNVYVNFMLG